MQTTSAIAIACLTAVAFLGGCSGRCETQTNASVDRSADEAAIRSILEKDFAAANALDPDGVAATYTPDGDAWIAGLAKYGVRDTEADFEALPGFQRWNAEIKSIRFISRDAAIVEIAATTTLDRGSFDEKTTIVVARSEGDWRIAAWRVMNFDETLLNLMKG